MQITAKARAEIERLLASHPAKVGVRLYAAGHG